LGRVRYSVVTAAPVNYASESTKLAEQIKAFSLASNGDSLFVQ
jgi:hypothetical protein